MEKIHGNTPQEITERVGYFDAHIRKIQQTWMSAVQYFVEFVQIKRMKFEGIFETEPPEICVTL